MTLQNLLSIGRLKPHVADKGEVNRLLAPIKRNVADAEATSVSDETRFDAAHKAVMQCALVAMMLAGYRPSTSEPGHHQTLIQALPLTLGVDNGVWVVLDGLRRQRNASDYSGHPIPPSALRECLTQAKVLERALLARLNERHPEFLKADNEG